MFGSWSHAQDGLISSSTQQKSVGKRHGIYQHNAHARALVSPQSYASSLAIGPESLPLVGLPANRAMRLQCGGCWAFAAAAAVESDLLINKNKYYNISEQLLIGCADTSEFSDKTVILAYQ